MIIRCLSKLLQFWYNFMNKIFNNVIIISNSKTTDEWDIAEPLKQGQLGIETSPNFITIKLGDGEHKWSSLKRFSINPSLTTEQKNSLKKLMDDYFNNKDLFIYDGSFRRESYAYPNTVPDLNSTMQGCVYNEQYVLNCGVFAQMIWMGRKITDFSPTPSTKINKEFDWGYYFGFTSCRRAYGVTKASGTKYNTNTYLSENGNRYFITFDNAAAMAQELFQKGYEIPYSEIDIGDLVFYRSDHISDKDDDGLEQSSFRYITHVGVVYDITEYGPIIIESSNAYVAAIGKAGFGDNMSSFSNIREAGIEQRVVMAARHPVAWGHIGNVPSNFTKYRGVDAQ